MNGDGDGDGDGDGVGGVLGNKSCLRTTFKRLMLNVVLPLIGLLLIFDVINLRR